MMRVIVDQDIAPVESVRAGLPDDWEVTVGLPGEESALLEVAPGYDAMLVTSRIGVTERVIEEVDSLEVIGKLGTGIDNVDLEAARAAGLPVLYTPGYNALSVAELGLGLLLATARRFTEARRLLRNGGWRDEFTLGTRVTGSAVGIIGLGNVGKRFAHLLAGFDVTIRYYDPYLPSIEGEIVSATPADLDTILQESDFVCTMPELTTETRGLIGADEFALMKDDAIVINTSRGPVIDEDALVDALQNDDIAGAGLDVYAEEPLPSDSPLLDLDNVVLTPHAGAMTTEDREKTIFHLTRNLRAYAAGDAIDDEFLAVPGEPTN